MTITEARIRRRLLGTRQVQVFRGGEEVFSDDDDVVKVRRTLLGVRLWTLWSHWRDGEETEHEVVDWWFPTADEVRVNRP